MSGKTARLSATEFAKTHYKTPALVEHGIRCGKPNCECRGDYRHGPYAYLYWRDGIGRANRRYVPKAEVDEVRTIIERRQAAQRDQRRERDLARIGVRTLMRWLRELRSEVYGQL
jgi:hypothetical protein